MSNSRIIGIGTANPALRLTQEQSFHVAGYQSDRIRKMFLNSDIDYRHFHLEGDVNRDESSDQLNQRYLRGAMKTGCRAIVNCLAAAGRTVRDVDFLAVCTCTGYVCPDLGSRLIAHMGFRNDVQRTSIVGLGCAGAVPTLQRAVDFVRANPSRAALMLAVEICSTCYYLDNTLETVVGNAICADGAAAFLLDAGDAANVRYPEVVDFQTFLDPEQIEKVGLRHQDGNSLQSNVPGSLRQAVITIGEIHYRAWGSLLHSVQTGSPAFNHVFGPGLFNYLHSNTESAATFNQGMTDLSSMLAYAVLMAYDFSAITSIVDVGGGQGGFLKKILEFHPEIAGTVFDLPSTIETTKEYLNGATCGGRYSSLGGDFFKDVPVGADAYVLCGVIHDWDDDHGLQILKNCHRAMAKNGRVLLVETVVPDTDANCFSKLLDLNMLVMTGGRERTKAEFCALFDAAGYKLTKIIPTIAPQSVIEAIPQ